MKLALFIACLLLWGTTQASTYTSRGSGVDENCDISKALAVNNALERFSMREFEVKKKHICKDIKNDISCFYQKQISSEAAGTFKNIVSQKQHKDGSLCYTDLVIEIEKIKLLDVEVFGKDRFLSGDVFDISVRTKEPLFIYIYNDHTTGLQRLYPHLDNKHELVFGTFKLSENKNINYRVFVSHPYEQSEESIVVVFSKVKLTFNNRLSKSEFYDTIKAVPAFSRRVVYHNVVINRRSK